MVPEMNSETTHFKEFFKKNVAVIGNPIEHSQSPLIHNYFLEKFEIPAHYRPIKIESDKELSSFLDQLRTSEWVGTNITIPFKEKVIPLLDEYDDVVKSIGACNTIINKNGKLIGFNTDAEGFYYPIKEKKINQVVILGNGGAAKAVLYQCAKNRVNNMTLIARDHSKSKTLIEQLKIEFNATILLRSFESIEEKLMVESDMVVNTTSVGMKTDDKIFDCVKLISKNQLFYDLIYSPWKTRMMKVCEKNGAEVMNGAAMLAHQGALAFEKFFGKKANTETMIKLLKQNTER